MKAADLLVVIEQAIIESENFGDYVGNEQSRREVAEYLAGDIVKAIEEAA